MVNQDKLYEFLYNGCVYESSPATISIHRTREGAYKAMNEHREEKYKQFLEDMEKMRRLDLPTEHFEFGEYEEWDVHEILLQD